MKNDISRTVYHDHKIVRVGYRSDSSTPILSEMTAEGNFEKPPPKPREVKMRSLHGGGIITRSYHDQPSRLDFGGPSTSF